MEIRVQISDKDITTDINNIIHEQVKNGVIMLVSDKLKSLNLDDIIYKIVEKRVLESKYLNLDVIRNLVQQKIARDIQTTDILNDVKKALNIK